MRPEAPGSVDALYADVLRAGEDLGRLRALIAERQPEDVQLRSLLRRAVPVRLLEYLGTTPPWCDRPLVAAAVVQNPRTPRHVAQRLVGALYWRDLAEVAAAVRLQASVRQRAEAQLRDMLRDMRPGDRITLGRLATAAVLRDLLKDGDERVLSAALDNPRLREDDLLAAIRDPAATRALLARVPEGFRWRDRYAVRLALVLQPRSPLGVSLGQLSSLLVRDLRQVAQERSLPPLVRAAAVRLEEAAGDPPVDST